MRRKGVKASEKGTECRRAYATSFGTHELGRSFQATTRVRQPWGPDAGLPVVAEAIVWGPLDGAETTRKAMSSSQCSIAVDPGPSYPEISRQ